MNNVSDITERLDDWRLVLEFYTSSSGDLVKVYGNYRKTANQINIDFPGTHSVRFDTTDVAQLQNAIKKYEERDM